MGSATLRRFKPVFGAVVYIARRHPLSVITLCGLSVLMALAPAAKLWISKIIIDAVVTRQPVALQMPSAVLVLLILYLFVLLVASWSAQLIATIRELLGEVVVHRVTRTLLEHAAWLDLAHFERPEFYDKLRRAEQDATQRPVLVLSQLIQLAQSVVTLSSMVYVLFQLHWIAFLTICAFGSPQLVLQVAFAKRGHDLRVKQTPTTRKMHYLAHLLSSADAFKEVRVFRLARFLLDRHDEVWRSLFADRRHLAVRRTIAGLASSAASTLAYVGFYAVAVSLAFSRRLTVGELVLYNGAYLQCQAEIASILSSVSGLYENALFIGTLQDFLQFRPAVKAPDVPAPILPSAGQCLEVRDVWFRYPGCENWVLKDVSFRVRAGERVALVGQNGAGKTTLVKLICRFYDPDKGQILLDGRDIRSFAPEEYQTIISAVFQDFVRYHLSVRLNIGAGQIDEAWNDERLRAAARMSGAEDFIRELEKGYETTLGRVFREGRELSVGQWQKLAIARAFMRDGRILILDEPVASLDPLGECEVMEAMGALARERICLLVSHRMMHASRADRVLVCEQGRIVEEGSHLELLARGGRYSKLFRTQAASFGADPGAVVDLRKEMSG
jgi:ATP-binding cassette, subfamily B, bacterial